jgi:hypothetical protein
MKRFNTTCASASWIFLVVLLSQSCSKSSIPYTQNGNWVSRSSFNGPNRSEAVVFTIGSFAYMGTGVDQNFKRYNDLWAYDVANDNWTQLANMPDSNRNGGLTARSSAVAFSVATKGYVGTGYNGYNPIGDFWEYDQPSNEWTQKADFAGTARYDAVAFGIQSFGYVSTGYDGSNAQKDFWQYDPANDVWTQKVSMGGDKRSGAVAFVYKDKGYILTGINSGTQTSDFWVFDPSQPEASSWKQLRRIINFSSDNYDDGYINIVRTNAVAMVISDRAYLTCGANVSLYNTTWEYHFDTDLWQEKTPFEGAFREGAIGFSVDGRGYVGLGKSASAAFDDLREFHPDEVYNAND